MKINKNAWHYKLQRFWRFSPVNNLCSYFWSTVLGVLLFPIVPFLFVTSLFFILLPFIWFFFSDIEWLGVAITVGFFEIMALLFSWVDYRREKNIHDKLSVTREYIKAKKQKICPLIEYVEE